jgi:WD40 repeat protein
MFAEHSSAAAEQSCHTPIAHPLEVRRIGQGIVSSVAWNEQSKQIAVGASTGIWLYTESFEVIAFFETENVLSITWNPDGSKVAVGKLDSTTEVWDVIVYQLFA